MNKPTGETKQHEKHRKNQSLLGKELSINYNQTLSIERTDLKSRICLIYFFDLIKEFGGIIPWLKKIEELRYSGNEIFFADEFKKRLIGEIEGKNPIQVYVFLENNENSLYYGGMLHFEKSPESFSDKQLVQKQKELENNGYSYITCLIVRDNARKKGIGSWGFRNTLEKIKEKHPKIRGVVSDFSLLERYKSIGFQIEYVSKQERLAIISIG